MKGGTLKYVKEMKYLRIVLGERLSFSFHIAVMKEKMKVAVGGLNSALRNEQKSRSDDLQLVIRCLRDIRLLSSAII